MDIEIGNKIIIRGGDDKLMRWLNEHYTITNPEYVTRVKLNKWLGNTPKTLKLFTLYQHGIVHIPYGCLREVVKFVTENYAKDTYTLSMKLNTNATAEWGNNTDIVARDYQQKAVDHMLSKKFGILKAPCSSGKTVMGHLIARGTGMKTLWLTHTKDLLNQSMAIGEMLVGKENVGTITDGKVNIGNVITYATIQTMNKLRQVEYAYEFGCVICDECHRVNTKTQATMFSKVVNAIPSLYKYGLSATPETFDGYGRTVFCNLGNIEYVIEKDVLEDAQTIMPVTIKSIYTNWRYPEDAYRANGTLDFHEAEKYLYSDYARNKLIIGLLQGKSTLILSNSIEHLCYMINELSPQQQKQACLISTKHDEDMILATDVRRKHSPKFREAYLNMMREGKLKYMFSTYQLAKEGLNIPCLEQVIMAFPAVDQNIITQTIGRVARTHPGKSEAVCYDIVDKPSYFRKKHKERIRLYHEEGNKVEE